VLAKGTGTLSPSDRVLIALGASVGIGSMLWHTLANSWTLILDIVPILIFLIWYIWLYTRNVIGLRALFAGLSVGAFLLATFLAVPYAGVLHGAFLYTPGLIVALVLGIFQARALRFARFTLLLAAGVYFAALFFRTIDQEVCPVLPIGTHFIWHSLIGLVTYLAMHAFILGSAVGEERGTRAVSTPQMAETSI